MNNTATKNILCYPKIKVKNKKLIGRDMKTYSGVYVSNLVLTIN